MISRKRMPMAVPAFIAVALTILITSVASGQIDRGDFVVSGHPASDTTGSGGQVVYTVSVKDDSTFSALGLLVTIDLPANVTFVKCSTSVADQPCTHSAGVVTATIAEIGAHSTVNVNVTIKNPVVSAKTVITLYAEAKAEQGIGGMEPREGSAYISGTVVPDVVPVVFLPSLQADVVACGQTLTPSFFGSDQTVQFADSLACPNTSFGVKIATSNVTLDLNGKKIVGAVSDLQLGSAGIIIGAGATDVTVLGRSTAGTAGVEYFDYCLMDEGGNTGLIVSLLRCFRGRSAGIDIMSDGVLLDKVLVDRTIGGAATAEPPGGVGIRATGNVHIKQSIARRSKVIGIWGGAPVDPAIGGGIVQIDSSTQVQDAEGIGIFLEGQSHLVKDVVIDGNGITASSTHGIVVNASGVMIDGVSVKQFAQHGFVINGDHVTIKRSGADSGGLDGFVLLGGFANLSGNSAKRGRHGFVIGGADAVLETNTAEAIGGTGFTVTGPRVRLNANAAKKVKGDGFSIAGEGGTFETNSAEYSVGTGWVVKGQQGTFNNNRSSSSYTKGGWTITGTGNVFSTNSASRNYGIEWTIGPGNIDRQGNSRNGRGFTFGLSGGTFD